MKNAKAKPNAETADAGAQGANVASETAAPTRVATQKKGAAKGKKSQTKPAAKKTPAKATKKAAKPATPKKAGAPRAESKGATILALVARPKGATLAELMTATGWQSHSIRGFVSNCSKKRSVKIESTRSEAGRVYRLA